MKKRIIIALCFVLLAAVAISVSASSISEKPATPEEDEWVTANRVIPDEIPVFDPSTVDLYSPEEAMSRMYYESVNFPTYSPKYRSIYYICPTFLYDLVDRQEVDDWYNETVKPDIENNVEPTEMYTVNFVKHFHIAKEDFERLSAERLHDFEERAEKTGEKIDTEFHEIHNADIIYTFDNEIINNYYLRNQG